MLTILITGGTGFLGRHIQKVLMQYNQHQIIIPSSRDLNCLNRSELTKTMKALKPDVVLHMAALCGGILANKNSPADFLHVNLDMGSNIFHAAKEAGCTCIYTLGSVCAYPKYCPIPFKEEDIWAGYPEETNAPYGLAKKVLLMLSQTYREQYGFTGAHLIPVNLYGEYDHFNLVNSHVIPALIRKFSDAVRDGSETVTCWGTGEATREFLYAGDAAQAIVHAILSQFDSPLPINLGTGKDISIKDLAELISDLTGFQGRIQFDGTVSDGQPRRLLDVTRARDLLDWTACTTLPMGLRRTIDWYQQQA